MIARQDADGREVDVSEIVLLQALIFRPLSRHSGHNNDFRRVAIL
jgi:hypothetical protein